MIEIFTKDIIVSGDVHITGNLELMNPNIKKYVETNIDDTSVIYVYGDLYIQSKQVIVINAKAYYTNIIKRSKTLSNKTTIKDSLIMSSDKLYVLGEIISEKNITYYSDKVYNKVKRAKINKIKSIIEDKNGKKQKTN